MILRKVLQLYQSPGPAPGASGAIILLDPADRAVLAYSPEHGLVLGGAGFSYLEPQLHHLPNQRIRGRFRQIFGLFLTERSDTQASLCEPFLQLRDAVRVLQSGQLVHPCGGLVLDLRVYLQRRFGEFLVDHYAVPVDPVVQVSDLDLGGRGLVAPEAFKNGPLYFYIASAIFHEPLPLLRRVSRKISRPAAVRFRRGTGLAEVVDEARALFDLLIFQLQRGANTVQTQGQAVIGREDHAVLPLSEGLRIASPLLEAGALKLGVVCDLYDVRVCQISDDLVIDREACLYVRAGQVQNMDWTVVVGISDQKDLEHRALDIPEDTDGADVLVTVCLDVQVQILPAFS